MAYKYGILSTSSIAPRFIAALRQAGVGEIVALSSRTLQKAQEKAKLWDIPRAYGAHMQLLEDKDIDVVYISTVNALHYQWAKLALEHGKHVICEKPCTTSSDQTRALFALARQRGLFFIEAQKMLFLPAVIEAKKRIEAGQLGKICKAELSHSFDATYNTWMFDAQAGGGPLLSSGIYAVQLMIWLFGEITQIAGVCQGHENGVEKAYTLTGVTQSGVRFTAANSTCEKLENTAKIYGTKGYLELPEYWKARQLILHTQEKEETLRYPCEHELIYEIEHINKCLQDGHLTSPIVTPALSVSGIQALESVQKLWKNT